MIQDRQGVLYKTRPLTLVMNTNERQNGETNNNIAEHQLNMTNWRNQQNLQQPND